MAFICVVGSIHIFNYGISPSAKVAQFVPPLNRGSLYYYLAENSYIITSAILRTSIAILLLRIATSKAQRIVIYMVMILMLSFSTAFLFTTVFQCKPVGFFWDWWPADSGKCNNHELLARLGYAHMALTFVADWTLALLPIWLLWDVQISRKRKIGVAIVLGFGLVSVVLYMLLR